MGGRFWTNRKVNWEQVLVLICVFLFNGKLLYLICVSEGAGRGGRGGWMCQRKQIKSNKWTCLKISFSNFIIIIIILHILRFFSYIFNIKVLKRKGDKFNLAVGTWFLLIFLVLLTPSQTEGRMGKEMQGHKYV